MYIVLDWDRRRPQTAGLEDQRVQADDLVTTPLSRPTKAVPMDPQRPVTSTVMPFVGDLSGLGGPQADGRWAPLDLP